MAIFHLHWTMYNFEDLTRSIIQNTLIRNGHSMLRTYQLHYAEHTTHNSLANE